MSHGERINGIVADLQAAQREMTSLLKAADDAAATRKPDGGGWTAAQIGYHVGLANARLVQTAEQRTEPAPADFVENPNVLAGIPPKVKTFEALEPPAEINKGAAIEKIDEGFAAIIETFRTLPESRSNEIVKFPFGPVTMYQLGDFVVGHARRHLDQIRRALG